MNVSDTARLMTIVGSAEDRQFTREDRDNWHLIIGHLDADKAQAALIKHLQTPTFGKTRPGHITAMADQIRKSDPQTAWMHGAA